MRTAINGGCWVELEPEKCEALGGKAQIFRGRCYAPALPLPRERPPTSHPPLKP
jgi:hypothetical protein